jgi:single-strand DNA-binding protein
MNDINSVTLTGRLTKDIEVKQVGETTIGKFDIACGYSEKVKGEWVKKTSFLTCKKWRVEKISQYLVKGQMVAVNGKIVQEQWTDKEGKKASKIIVMADELMLLGGNKSDNKSQQSTQQNTPSDNGMDNQEPSPDQEITF